MESEIAGWRAAGLRVLFDFSHRATPRQLDRLSHVEVAFFSGQKIGRPVLKPPFVSRTASAPARE
jgi:hypothetical protein